MGAGVLRSGGERLIRGGTWKPADSDSASKHFALRSQGFS